MTRSTVTGIRCLVLLASLVTVAGAGTMVETSACCQSCNALGPDCIAEVLKVCQPLGNPPQPPLDPEAWTSLTELGVIGLLVWGVKGIIDSGLKYATELVR